jgi:fibronectin-binding autotransporter adhesin
MAIHLERNEMKKILIFLLALMMVGAACAAPAKMGGAQGIRVANLWVDGNAIVSGTATYGVSTATGNIGADQTWAADKDIKASAGSGEIDWSAATGTTKTTTGTNTLNGNVVIAGAKTLDTGTGAIGLNGAITIAATKGITKTAGAGNFDFSAGTGTFLTSTGTNTLGGDVVISGSKTLTTSTGATTLNGPVGVAAGIDIVAAGAGSDIDYALSTTGIFVTPGGAITIGPGAIGITGTQTIASGKDVIAAGGASDIDFSLSSGVMKTPTGAITMSGATTWLADKGIAYTSGSGAADFSLGSGVFKTTTGAVTIGPGAVGVSGAVTLAKTIQYSINASTTLDTVLTSANTKTIYPMDGSGGTVTLDLPDATTVPGREYIVSAPVDMGTNNIVVRSVTGHLGANGSGNVHSLTSTDATASLSVISDGTNYVVLSRVGIWT